MFRSTLQIIIVEFIKKKKSLNAGNEIMVYMCRP